MTTTTKTECPYFVVRENRHVHNKLTGGRVDVWAKPGDIIKIDHPIVEKKLEGQMHKLKRLKGLPKGQKVLDIPQRMAREIEAFDARSRDGSEDGLPGVSRPSREMQDRIDALTKENQELRARLDKLESKSKEE